MECTSRVSFFRWGIVCFAALILGPAPDQACALGPHELLLLVNRNSYDSLTVANHYIALRGVPLSNVLYLDLPDDPAESGLDISPAEFTRSIWDPAQSFIRERELSGHILAWVFSAGFPVRIGTDPPLSIQGLVFTGNMPPDAEAVTKGMYPSALFRGPVGPDAPAGPPLTLETLRAGLGERMPRVSMTLAHTGLRGLSRAEAVDLLRRSATVDASHPAGTVYFVVSDDVRSKAREWQYDGAIAELKARGLHAVRTETFPHGAHDVVGLLMGAASAHPERIGAFLPGAMAEHLTSWAATFDRPHQTKVTAWLQAGAYSSAGTVTEPMSVWTKFPAARFFAHYAHGCTLLESFAQSVASPVQLLLLGDPLAAPWKPKLSLEIEQAEADHPQEAPRFHARLAPQAPADYLFFLDGRRVSPLIPHPAIRIGADLDGSRTLRAVAYLHGPVRHQAFAETEIRRPVPGRAVQLSVSDSAETFSRSIPIRLTVRGEGAPQRIHLHAQGRRVETIENGGPADVEIDPEQLGAGPVEFRAVAEFPDGRSLQSAPLRLEILDEDDSLRVEEA